MSNQTLVIGEIGLFGQTLLHWLAPQCEQINFVNPGNIAFARSIQSANCQIAMIGE